MNIKKNIAIAGLLLACSINVYAITDLTVTNQTDQAVNVYWGPDYTSSVNIQNNVSKSVPATQILVGLQQSMESWEGNITHSCTLKTEHAPNDPLQLTSVTCNEVSFVCVQKYSLRKCPSA